MSSITNSLQTAERIVSASTKLFLKKGYEKTSIQDITDALGMSRGAIFYHFKSKEDIFYAVLNKQSESMAQAFSDFISQQKKGTAREKIIALLEHNVKDTETRSPIDTLIASQLRSPRFIVANMQEGINKSAPILAKLLKDGVKDGSITTKNPEECAEVFFLLMNAWCDHVLFECDINRLNRRLQYLQQIMKQMGADILSDKTIKEYIKFIEKLYKGSKK